MLTFVPYWESDTFSGDTDFLEQRFRDALIVNRYVDTSDVEKMGKNACELGAYISREIRSDIFDFVEDQMKSVKKDPMRQLAVVEYCNSNKIRVEFFHEENGSVSKEIDDLSVEIREEINQEKSEYYGGEFFVDSDSVRISLNGEDTLINFKKIDEEIILENNLCDLADDDEIRLFETAIRHYFSKDWSRGSLDSEFDRGDWMAQLQNAKNNEVWIKYRGGSGYCYAFCGYPIEFLNSLPQ